MAVTQTSCSITQQCKKLSKEEYWFTNDFVKTTATSFHNVCWRLNSSDCASRWGKSAVDTVYRFLQER